MTHETDKTNKPTYYLVWHRTRRIGEFTPAVWHADLWHNKQYHPNEKRSAMQSFVYPLTKEDERGLLDDKNYLDVLAAKYPAPMPSDEIAENDND